MKKKKYIILFIIFLITTNTNAVIMPFLKGQFVEGLTGSKSLGDAVMINDIVNKKRPTEHHTPIHVKQYNSHVYYCYCENGQRPVFSGTETAAAIISCRIYGGYAHIAVLQTGHDIFLMPNGKVSECFVTPQ